MKKYMDEGLSFQQAHNKAEATGAPAFPNQNKKLGYILNQDLMNKPGFAGAKHQFENQVLGMTDNQFDNQQKRLDKLSNQLDIITGTLGLVLLSGIIGVAASQIIQPK